MDVAQSVSYDNELGVVVTTIKDAWDGHEVVQVKFDYCVRLLDSDLLTEVQN